MAAATPHKCILCGTANAACGVPTISLPVDAVVTGYRVAGNTVMPDVNMVPMGDMTEDEIEEFRVMSQAYERRRTRMRGNNMAEGAVAYTSLVYVDCPDGIRRKMAPGAAEQYVEMHEGASIAKRGEQPVPEEGEIIGASKATIGEMFDADGRQRVDVQPMTTRVFMASDATRSDVVTPAIGGVGSGEHTPSNTGAHTTSSTPKVSKPEPPKPD